MNDQQDSDRFQRLAGAFTQKLGERGLIPANHRPISSDCDGWWAVAAKWPGEGNRQSTHRPRIEIVFNCFLGGPHRDVWFGFYSDREEPIATLLREVRGEFPQMATYNAAIGEDAYREELIGDQGLGYEQCDTDEYYFGKYDFGFKTRCDEELVDQAADFIMDVVGAAEPGFAERRDIEEIKRDKSLRQTEREALILARRGQGKFRADLIK